MSDAPTAPIPTGDGIFANALWANAVPKVTMWISGALVVDAHMQATQANAIAPLLAGGLFGLASVVWTIAKHRNTQSVVARVAAGTAPAVISNSKAL